MFGRQAREIRRLRVELHATENARVRLRDRRLLERRVYPELVAAVRRLCPEQNDPAAPVIEGARRVEAENDVRRWLRELDEPF
jgi:hypothetical protein